MNTTHKTAPVIELRKFEFYPHLSEETNAYNAVIRVDGVDCIDASNEGKGGGDRYQPLKWDDSSSRAAFQKGMDTIKAHLDTLPPLQTRYGEMPFVREIEGGTKDYAVDLFIGQIVEKLIREKDEAKQRNTYRKKWETTLFATNEQGQLVTLSLKVSKSTLKPADLVACHKRHPNLKFIEADTFDTAWPKICAALYGEASTKTTTSAHNDAPLPAAVEHAKSKSV